MNAIKLMPEYGETVLWNHDSPDDAYVIDPQWLDLTPSLLADISAWAKQYDQTLDPETPDAAGFPSPQSRSVFVAEGRDLATRLRDETRRQVVYLNLDTGELEDI